MLKFFDADADPGSSHWCGIELFYVYMHHVYRILLESGFRIRIELRRIRIQHFLIADPDQVPVW
jgi:hypothetical protein